MKSVMKHNFGHTPSVDIPRSSFFMPSGRKMTFEADLLYPLYVFDVIPGDTLNLNCHFHVKLASPTLYPLMDNLHISTFWFFVPYRILWTNWEKFMGAQVNPADSIDYTVPALGDETTFNVTTGNAIFHYMGLPWVSSCDLTEINAFPWRAYNRIWNEWFRHEALQNSLANTTNDGPDDIVNYGIQYRCKGFDYFTSALPWPQRGDAVSLPLGSTADIFTATAAGSAPEVYSTSAADFRRLVAPSPVPSWVTVDTVAGASDANKLYADLSGATAATINDIRYAFQVQRLLERDARSGTRYVETLKAHWGVDFPDYTAARPVYLGGGETPIQMSQVAQTTYQGSGTLLDSKGALASIGSASGTHGFTKSFVEHGVVIGLVNAWGDVTYSQGIDKYFLKSTRYDFYYPVLSHLGEQAITNAEIFYQNDANDDLVFGYTERYNEYRFKNSDIKGLLVPDHASTLAAYHLSEDFGSLPTLGSDFIIQNTRTPLDRAIAVPSQPAFVGDFYFEMKAARPMPVYGTPGMLDHF